MVITLTLSNMLDRDVRRTENVSMKTAEWWIESQLFISMKWCSTASVVAIKKKP